MINFQGSKAQMLVCILHINSHEEKEKSQTYSKWICLKSVITVYCGCNLFFFLFFLTSPCSDVLERYSTCINTSPDSTTLFYCLSLTFLIETLVSLSIPNIFDDETGKWISFVSKSLQTIHFKTITAFVTSRQLLKRWKMVNIGPTSK